MKLFQWQINVIEKYLKKIPFSQREKQKQKILKKLEKGIPLEYILKKVEFYKREFYVDERAFIPRDETEIMMKALKDNIKPHKKIKIVDICTGSGNIGISIALEFNLDLIITDKYIEPLEVAKINIKKFQLENKIKIIRGNLLDFFKNNSIDIITVNPPYIDIKEKHLVQKSVIDYEPFNALFAKKNGLEFIEKILKQAKQVLKDNGFILMEINERRLKQIENLIKQNNFKLNKVYRTVSKIPRIILIKKNLTK